MNFCVRNFFKSFNKKLRASYYFSLYLKIILMQYFGQSKNVLTFYRIGHDKYLFYCFVLYYSCLLLGLHKYLVATSIRDDEYMSRRSSQIKTSGATCVINILIPLSSPSCIFVHYCNWLGSQNLISLLLKLGIKTKILETELSYDPNLSEDPIKYIKLFQQKH